MKLQHGGKHDNSGASVVPLNASKFIQSEMMTSHAQVTQTPEVFCCLSVQRSNTLQQEQVTKKYLSWQNSLKIGHLVLNHEALLNLKNSALPKHQDHHQDDPR